MNKLNNFINILAGSFDNSEQFKELESRGITNFPFAKHVNTICNDKITNLPKDFQGIFLVEESYYTSDGKTHSSPHLFLFTEENEGIKLTSYELPKGYDKNTFTYTQLESIDYNSLKISEKFTPAIYTLKDNVWEGGSVSMFSPVLKFTLFERFSEGTLEVSESMEVNGKRTFGYDQPIIYKKIHK
ncbi:MULTISPECIES: hypothetical protein [Clostridium]|uniref:Uncharacterized protein n=1 Tax=Clostridium senegalense TaxID=1465809 RepID=A0A6M0H6B9_9CLOT|nr:MULTISPECIES: hypothetical protein [Clostridium]NEU05878.1 hypothetical protein [Clostridium senegalense]